MRIAAGRSACRVRYHWQTSRHLSVKEPPDDSQNWKERLRLWLMTRTRDDLDKLCPSPVASINGSGRNGRVLKRDVANFIVENDPLDTLTDHTGMYLTVIKEWHYMGSPQDCFRDKAAGIKEDDLLGAFDASGPPEMTGSILGVGGLDSIIKKLNEQVYVPLVKAPTASSRLDVELPKGILLHGPPGSGKSLLAARLAKVLTPDLAPTIVKGPELIGPFWGEAEENVRKLFEPADSGQKLKIVILDEADVLLVRRGANPSNQHMERTVSQFLSCMDGASERSESSREQRILFIATTNRKNDIDPALLRPGRFSLCFEFPSTPCLEGRLEILKLETKALRQGDALSPEVEELLADCAELTNGFSGADLSGFVTCVKMKALQRCASLGPKEQKKATISEEDLMDTLRDKLEQRGQSQRFELLSKRIEHDRKL